MNESQQKFLYPVIKVHKIHKNKMSLFICKSLQTFSVVISPF